MSDYILACDYEEFEPATYNGVYMLEFDENNESREVLRINTGNFMEDYNQIIKQFDQGFTISSSIVNFMVDFKIAKHDKLQYVVPHRKYSNIISGVKLVKEDNISKSIRLTKERDEKIF
ncbi:hypothetical protein [Desulforamulus aeronauticus]|uniref:Uncharacterized protein n=1 Tax=Desulforamulus aeronauticus DSM 10349 TaxID=1121421 RepID=A0A1M6SAN3_9FIRM|nr:hypothetical protein [Desulforamulus aeronauticus]SHK41812.1 hypothetical protein SAMN02745123_01773 [Desulforamulus aeronauticus DSM 10349]